MPVDFLDVVLVDQIAPAYRLAVLKRAWREVLERLDRARPPHDESDTRWRQYLSDLRRLADENWDYTPLDFMDWDGCGAFPSKAKRALAWVMGGRVLTNLTRDAAVCGRLLFRRLPGDQGWNMVDGPQLDRIKERGAAWLAD
jgi:hypothetical protein